MSVVYACLRDARKVDTFPLNIATVMGDGPAFFDRGQGFQLVHGQISVI